MRKWMLCLGAFLVLAQAEPNTVYIGGQARVNASIIRWSSSTGTYFGKTRHMFLNNNVYLDTSATGLAGQWKRIDNTADSCSDPIPLTSTYYGAGMPILQSPQIGENVYSRDKDSSIHVYRMRFRDRYALPDLSGYFTSAWTQKGTGLGYADQTISDSILIPSVPIAQTKIWAYGIAWGLGVEAQACPDDVAATANESQDSVIVDTSWAPTR